MTLSFLTPLLLLVCFCMMMIFFSHTLSTIQPTFLLSTLNSTPFPLGYLPSSFISTVLSRSICTCTSFSTLNHLLNDHLPPVKTSVFSLERVGSFKFLGILLKPSLSWTDHINLKQKKTLHRHFYMHCTPDTLSLMLPYKTLVRPYYNTVQFSRIPPPYRLLPLLNLSNICP